MRTHQPNMLHMMFAVCQAISPRDGVRQAIALFQESGGRFVYKSGLDPHPDPQSLVDDRGNLRCRSVRHPALSPAQFADYEVQELGPLARELPRASFSCYPLSGRGSEPLEDWRPVRAIRLAQPTGFEDERKVDTVALGLIRTAGVLYPLFRPEYGYVDEEG